MPKLSPERRRWYRAATARLEQGFAPKPRISVSEWADRYRMIAEGTSVEAGRWKTDRTPYLREIMDCFSDSVTRRIVFKKPAQVGATEAFLNVMGYFMHQDPCPMLVVQVSKEEAEKWSKEKLAPMIEATEVLRDRVSTPKSRDPDNTVLSKRFTGGHLGIIGANSPAGFRQRSRRLVLFDDVDGFPLRGAGTEGDQVTLGERRATTFWNRKLGYFSTPTIEGISRIDSLFQEGDQRYFEVPCPACGCWQRMPWLREEGSYSLVCERDASNTPIPLTARFACEGCGVLLPESEKYRMVLRGRWIPTAPFTGTASFHCSALCSNYISWPDIMAAFLSAKRSPLTLQGFVNTVAGEVFRETAEDIEPHFLEARAESYGVTPEGQAAEVPHGVGLLTFGADVQADRIEAVVWGWGTGEQAWAIAWEQFWGDPTTDLAVWANFDAFLQRPFRHVSGASVRIAAGGVDSNYATDKVYAFTEPRLGRGIWPVRGMDGRGRPIWKAPDPRTRSKAKTRHLVIYGTDSAKDAWHAKLKLMPAAPGEPDPTGLVHFPESLDRVFYEQLTSERLVTELKRGRPVRVWKLPDGRRNEVLDCSGIALGALLSLGMPILQQLGAMATALSAGQGTVVTPPRRGRMISRGIDF